jgi:parallel beta-helix repeat protein
MPSLIRRLAICLLLPAVLSLGSCLVSTPSTLILPEIRSLYEGDYQVDPYMKEHMPLSVAVLPFVDLSGSKEGARAMRLGFYNHFSSRPFKDMELHKIDELLERAGLADPELLRKTPPEKLGALLGVDAVIFGEVSDFDKYFLVMYSQVAVGAEVKMYDAKTGHFLWSGKHKVRKHEGGVSTNPVGIVATVIVTALNMRDIQLLRANDDLFRDMVKTIPAPTLAQAKRPPVISLLTQDTQGRPKKAGDQIQVVIQGASGMQAWFDIGQYRRRIEMQEVEPGGYYGVYKVVPGDNVEKAVVTGYLRDDTGNTAHWVDAVGSVTLDTAAPDAPAGVAALGRNRSVSLRWGKSAAADLAGYRIYRSETPLSGYAPAGRTELNAFTDADPTLVNARTYYYRLTAVDAAGNESLPAGTEAIPVAPGPTPVAGAIASDTVWYSGASPYVLEDDVVVQDKALLTIEPGTEIQSRGKALIVAGRIAAIGDDNAFIRFDSARDGEPWPGILFSDVKDRENRLAFVRIRNARTAVTCRASSPIIENSELTQNDDALNIQGAFSKPLIRHNVIHKNRGTGITVGDGAAPRITENTVSDNDTAGLAVLLAPAHITGNTVARNRQNGLVVKGADALIRHNNLIGNHPYNLAAESAGAPVGAKDNWWGTLAVPELLAGLSGRVDIRSVLDAPWPGGKPHSVPVMEKNPGSPVRTDAYLTVFHSPYRISKELFIENGATLFIEPGVVLEFEQKASIVAAGGAVVARGTKERPITFTAASASPSPGFYTSAVRFAAPAKAGSSLAYCIVTYATTAFDVEAGSPEITRSMIAHASQSGVYCRREAAPVIAHNTFAYNGGEGAIRTVGASQPKIFQNNFLDNAVALQSFSSLHIDASHKWWGASPPGPKMIWGDNITIHPWLEKENPDAFRPGR